MKFVGDNVSIKLQRSECHRETAVFDHSSKRFLKMAAVLIQELGHQNIYSFE